MKKDLSHAARIESDLRKAGFKTYGFMKSETRELPHIIAEDEAIYGCIYGQHNGGSAMLVATDRRILFLDKKPMHLLLEEMTFERVVDIGVDWQPFFSKVTLNSRGEKYIFRYVNTRCARIFVRYLETAVLGMPTKLYKRDTKENHFKIMLPANFNIEESQYLASHALAVVSSNGKNGYPYGAMMFYFPDQKENIIRVVTRSETETAQNLRASKKVALTITDIEALATMHITGDATIDDVPEKGYVIMQQLLNGHPLLPKSVLPPVAQINDGAYVIFKITMASTYLRIYKNTP